nr:uncharacterized protein LOC106825305 isoform X2 [Equus asinus]
MDTSGPRGRAVSTWALEGRLGQPRVWASSGPTLQTECCSFVVCSLGWGAIPVAPQVSSRAGQPLRSLHGLAGSTFVQQPCPHRDESAQMRSCGTLSDMGTRGTRGSHHMLGPPVALLRMPPHACSPPQTPFSLTLKLWDAYILKEHLLKLPLEGLREFLQDRLGQPWALEDNAMLRHLQALMVELQRMKCDLPSPEEFPTVPLGLERASPEPRPVLASPSCEKLPSEAGLALPAYPSSTSGQDPRPPRLSPRPWSCSIRGPPRGPWLLTPLSEPQRLRVCPACPQPRTALGIGCSHSDFTSLPNLPGNHEAADRWPPAVGSELERWASLPLLPAWATPRATGQAQPCIPTGAPVTGPIQPDEDQATGPRTPFLPCDACSRCPSQGGEGHSGDEALAGPSELPQGLDCPLHPLISMSTRKLEAWVPLEGSVMERVMALKRPAVSSSVPRVVMLAVLEDGAPLS